MLGVSAVTIWLKRPGNTADRITIARLSATGVYRAAASVDPAALAAVATELRDELAARDLAGAEQVDDPHRRGPVQTATSSLARSMRSWSITIPAAVTSAVKAATRIPVAVKLAPNVPESVEA